jgi:putative cell wall-binding protein
MARTRHTAAAGRTLTVLLAALAMAATLALPAAADHTDPNEPLTPTPVEGTPGEGGLAGGEGTWEHLHSFRGHLSSDVTFFEKGGETYAAQGTLGQGPPGSIYAGQRIVRLLDELGRLRPRLRADHGSAACLQPATGATSLQHDSFATPVDDPELLIDTTDAAGRCHDSDGGGIELIDISGLDDPTFEPREVHLLRFNATTHTATRDPKRPHIIYSNNSAFSGNNWLEVVDLRTCLTRSAGGTLPDAATLEQKRAGCAPVVYRMPFEDAWTLQTIDGEGPPEGNPSSCHDTVIEDDVIYCSGLNAEVLLDISGMFDADGTPRGTPLPCERVDAAPGVGVSTGAKVTDCVIAAEGKTPREAYADIGSPRAEGWRLLGFYNHPGIDEANTNLQVPSTEGIAVSHETRPVPLEGTDRRFMVVSDERGGGVLPIGASCDSAGFNEFGNGGLHFFDITDPGDIRYATMVDEGGTERRAVWQGDVVVPSGTFCVVHRFRFLEGEQRIVMGYYSQGIKVLDYELDAQGRFRFTEVASYVLPQANSWTADVFHTRDNADGTRTYFIATSDTLGSTPARGMDILTWTAEPNPLREVGTPRPTTTFSRLSGPTRFETAVEVSRSRFEEADTVFLARADDYADALAGGPLAAAEGAPILLTQRDVLTGVTEREVQRLGASRAVLLGGEAAVGAAVAARLEALDLTVERVSGPNRWATAAAAAAALDDDSGTVFLTEGANPDARRGWPDAMSAAPYAAFAGHPILLTNAGELPPETRQALSDVGAEETIVVGGAAAVSDDVVAEVREAGHGPRRLAGPTRYETSRAVHDEALEVGMSTEVLWLATGGDWPDALTAGGVAGAAGEMVVLVDGTDLDRSPATRDLVAAQRGDLRHVNLLGGTAAISARVAEQLQTLLAGGAEEAAGPVPPGGPRGPLGLPGQPSAEALLLLLAALLLPAAALVGRRSTARPAA